MILSKEKQEELRKVVAPVVKWLNDNTHPHTHIIIDGSSAELSEGVAAFQIPEFIKD